MMVQIAQLNSTDADFQQSLDKLLAFENAQDDAVDVTVASILADIRSRKDAALIEYTNRFDRLCMQTSGKDLELTQDDLSALIGTLAASESATHYSKRRNGCAAIMRNSNCHIRGNTPIQMVRC